MITGRLRVMPVFSNYVILVHTCTGATFATELKTIRYSANMALKSIH